MSIFRSEDMALFEISIPKDNAWDIMDRLGLIDSMHFIDLNKNEQVFTLRFAPLVKRCEDADKRVQFLISECKRYNIPLKKPESIEELNHTINKVRSQKNIAPSLFFEEVEEKLKKTEQFVLEQTKKGKDMHDAFNQLLEYRTVLRETRVILGYQAGRHDMEFGTGGNEAPSMSSAINAEEDGVPNAQPLMGGNLGARFVNISGTINTDEVMRFRKLVFRATRGNALVYFSDIKKPIEDFYGVQYQKTVYCVLFQDSGTLRDKVTKICDSFLGQRFDVPNGGVEAKINEITQKIKETISVMRITKEEVRKYLVSVNTIEESDLSSCIVLKWFINKEKVLYQTLNKLKFGENMLVGLFWTPLGQIEAIRKQVEDIKQDRNIASPQIFERKDHGVIPPSHFRTNAFTTSF